MFFLSSKFLNAQSNCQNPLPVVICPSVFLANQTNAGMADDAPAMINIAGEDLVYEITVTNGAATIFVSIINSNAPLRLTLLPNICSSGSGSVRFASTGDSNFNFFASNSNIFYLWIDGPSTTIFDISIGADTGLTFINIPNTRGNIMFDNSGCAVPVFNITKPFFQVKYNGVFQTDPMTLSPLNATGSLCVTIFIKNTTGVEGIRRMNFHFNNGYSSVIVQDTTPGFFNSGIWIASNTNNDWQFDFYDSAGIGRGDFTGSPDSCLEYEFCFDIIPVSNNPVATNVEVNILTDGYGTGFNGFVRSGCCSSGMSNCFGGGFGFGSSGHGFGFAFADPGSSLPIQLTEFNAEINGDAVEVVWTTASEINNDYFEVERSVDTEEWKSVGRIDGAGNSSVTLHYKWIDESPLSGTSYYLLKQTDYDNKISYSEIVSVKNGKAGVIRIYPNPVYDQLTIETTGKEFYQFILYNVFGEQMMTPVFTNLNKIIINTSAILPGIYFLKIFSEEKEQSFKVIKR